MAMALEVERVSHQSEGQWFIPPGFFLSLCPQATEPQIAPNGCASTAHGNLPLLVYECVRDCKCEWVNKQKHCKAL